MELPAWLQEALARVGAELAGVLRYPLNSDQRLYGAYLLSALALALAVLLYRQRRREGHWHPLAALRELFSPRIWWHPSARLDYALFVLNPVIRSLLLVGGLSMVPVAVAV